MKTTIILSACIIICTLVLKTIVPLVLHSISHGIIQVP